MDGESRAVTTAREFREQLVRQEDAALREMARHWARIEKDLTDQFRLLDQEVREMRERGEIVPDQAIYNLQRYQQMMAQVMQELQKYDEDAVNIITAHQKESFTLGLDSAVATIMDTRPSDPMWNRIGADAAEVAAGFAGNGAPLGQLLQHDYGDIGMKVVDALVDGLALGKGAFATAKDMRDAMGMEYTRSVRIARTEINRAYRIANADQYAKSGVVTKVLRLCAKQANTCFACLEMDGEECPNGIVDDHPNGRCTSVAVTIGGHYPEWQKGHDWLMAQDEATQRAIMGDGRYEMWKQNGVPLRDMVKMEPNAVWGANPAVISERELRTKFNISGGNKTLFSVKPAPTFDRTKIQHTTSGERLIKQFDRDKVKYNQVSLLQSPLSEKEIISRISGGDMTQGSCMSLACAYSGNKYGLDVIDYRGGKSCTIMSYAHTELINLDKVSDMTKVEYGGGVKAAKTILKQVEPNKEYMFITGRHAAIVRLNEGKLQYLELQSRIENGWKDFEYEQTSQFTGRTYKVTLSDTLNSRFGCKGLGSRGISSLTDIEIFENNDEFRDILGYINTAESEQKKGASGTIK